MNFIAQFIEFSATPFFLLILGFSFFCLVLAKRDTKLIWLTFSLICFSASLAKAPVCDACLVPGLVFPFETWRDFGRPATLTLLGLFLVLVYRVAKHSNSVKLPKVFVYLLMVSFVVTTKNFLYGQISFALISYLVLGLLFLLLKSILKILQDASNFYLAVLSLAGGGLIFLFSSLYQGIYGFEALSYLNGQYMGMTSNPQMAALILSLTLPSFIYLLEMNKNKPSGYFWLGCMALCFLFVFLSGSRTGLTLSLVSVFLFYRRRFDSFVRVVIIFCLLALLFSPQIDYYISQFELTGTVDITLERFSAPTDTRTLVWKNLWEIFLDYPIFGIPLEGGRLGFGENSWLAVAASLGLIGLVPLALFGIEFLKIFIGVWSIPSKYPQVSLTCDLVISAFTVILIGSMAEAFLLGNITFPFFAFLIYVALGHYLVSVITWGQLNQ